MVQSAVDSCTAAACKFQLENEAMNCKRFFCWMFKVQKSKDLSQKKKEKITPIRSSGSPSATNQDSARTPLKPIIITQCNKNQFRSRFRENYQFFKQHLNVKPPSWRGGTGGIWAKYHQCRAEVVLQYIFVKHFIISLIYCTFVYIPT